MPCLALCSTQPLSGLGPGSPCSSQHSKLSRALTQAQLRPQDSSPSQKLQLSRQPSKPSALQLSRGSMLGFSPHGAHRTGLLALLSHSQATQMVTVSVSILGTCFLQPVLWLLLGLWSQAGTHEPSLLPTPILILPL